MQNAGEHFCLITCRDIIFYHFLVHEAIYERFFTVLRHIIWQERQEMRQNCGYPLHELHFAVHRKDGSIGATIGKRDGRSSRSWSSQGTRADTHAMQEVECFCQHSSLHLPRDAQRGVIGSRLA